MNFVKRGLRSLLYHWKNTAALVVIYFLSSALVLVGLNIRQACLATAEEAGEKIGADIAVTNTYQANSFTAEERNNLPPTLADQLAALPGVSSASWTATLSGASNNFSSAAMTREDGRAPLLFFASQTSSLLDLFTSQGASLGLGSPLEREDRGLALVALPLAEENGWELDSVFSVTAASGQENLEVESRAWELITLILLLPQRLTGQANNANRINYYRMFFTDGTVAALFSVGDRPYRTHERDLFAAMKLPFLDFFLEDVCRSVDAILSSDLKAYGRMVEGRPMEPPGQPLPNDVYLEYLNAKEEAGVKSASAISNQRAAYYKFLKENLC